MDFLDNLIEHIDLRSFSNLWFWIMLALFWSSASHWILGVPYDMVARARRHGGDAMDDLHELVRIKCKRITGIFDIAGTTLVWLVTFLLSTFAVLGFGYGIEFFQAVNELPDVLMVPVQAVFLLMLPMSIIGMMNLRAARKLLAVRHSDDDLYRRMRNHRMLIQFLGVISLFITTFWGMLQNFSTSAA